MFLFKDLFMKNLNFLILITLISFTVNAQEATISKNAFKGTHFVNRQSANLADRGDLLLQIQHRFGDICFWLQFNSRV